MIEERMIISDVSVLFDLLSVGLLDTFFALPWDIYTTDMVIAEMGKLGQKECADRFLKNKKLSVITFEFNELLKIKKKKETYQNNASMADMSVCYYAKKVNGRLLTDDRTLRTVAESDGVQVFGILYVFDKMVECNILSYDEAAENLEALISINGCIPPPQRRM